ncbi:hypothetical protein ACN469_24950 [Corallococcus terminator]
MADHPEKIIAGDQCGVGPPALEQQVLVGLLTLEAEQLREGSPPLVALAGQLSGLRGALLSQDAVLCCPLDLERGAGAEGRRVGLRAGCLEHLIRAVVSAGQDRVQVLLYRGPLLFQRSIRPRALAAKAVIGLGALRLLLTHFRPS